MTDYSSEDFWKGAPEASTHYQPPRAKGCNPVFWMVKNGVPVEAWAVISGGKLHHISDPRYEEDIFDKIIPRPAPPWSGDGLPPVGIPVEWSEWLDGKYQVVTVLAYAGGDAWIKPEGKPSMIVGRPAGFRPIKTPVQIAAEEREAAIDEMSGWAGVTGLPIDRERKILGRLYDGGYRKQEKQE